MAYLRRMRVYLGEMFPLPRHLGIAALMAVGLAAFARHAHGLRTSLLSPHVALGLFGVFGLLLILRLMDELKDADIDAALFPHRPLPSGRVRRGDIVATLGVVIVGFLAAHGVAARTLASACVLLGFATLMFRRFFAPARLRGSLLLTLATHAPVVPLLLLHGFVVFAVEHDLALADLRWRLVVPFTLACWMPILGWEIARKIRPPEAEDAYETYSRRLGPVGAVALVLGVEGVGLAATVWLGRTLSCSAAYVALPGGALLLLGLAAGRFLARPSPATARLRPWAELVALVVLATQVWEFAPWPR